MTPSAKEKLRQQIGVTLKALEVDIVALQQQTQPVAPDESIGRLTRLEAMNAKSMADANLRAAKERVSRLKAALERMDDADYGRCVVCDEPIPMGRLLLMPEATVCVRCKEEMSADD